MAQSRPNIKVKDSSKQKTSTLVNRDDSGCDTCPEESLTDSNIQDPDSQTEPVESGKVQTVKKVRGRPPTKRRLTSKTKADSQLLPNVGKTGSTPTTHSNMKTKQIKDEQDKSIDEDTIIEPKTRARKKASDIVEEDKKSTQEEPKTSKEVKKPVGKPKAVVKKRPLGIRKALRSKKALVAKEKVKNVIKQVSRRGRKPAIKVDTETSQDKESVPLIPASEIKKEPIDDTTPNSRSSSPKTAGRRQRVCSDMAMMKTMLSETPSSLVLGPRTSPYSMRSERSNSPSLFEGKNLRSGKPRKVKSNLLNEVVLKEQKKRRRLNSDSKASDSTELTEDCKKLKRGRSCSRDGSEISKCSDNTESDLSMSETLNDTDKELNKKLDKSKTDLDIDIENNIPISTTDKVPSLNLDSKVAETKPDMEPCNVTEKTKRKLSLNRSTSLDSDNNNSNRIKLEDINASELEDKLLLKTENDTLLEARSSILTSMSKTFNSKEVAKNIRKARRGRKAAVAARPSPSLNIATKNVITSTITNNDVDDKHETLDTLSKEISDLINNLDENIDRDHEMAGEQSSTHSTSNQMETKTVAKFYGLPKPLGNTENVPIPETPVKDKDLLISNENTPSKDDGENIRLHYEEDSVEKPIEGNKVEITYKCSPVASIDKLMDRLKEFEEFDKRRQRQEMKTQEPKSNDGKTMMVTNDVVLIPKSGDIKPLKDIQSVRSPERLIEKENVLSCFENNSAISIVKRDQVRKSVDIDLPNSVTLIKRNSFSARKESTSSNHSKESDAISLFEKSLGKDVTLTEIRKSVDKSSPVTPVDLHQFATLHPNNPAQSLVGVVIDSSQISITPRVMNDAKVSNDVQIIAKRKSRESKESISRKSSESANDNEEKMATIEKIKSPTHPNVSAAISITATPVALKSPEWAPIESAARPPPEGIFDTLKSYPVNEISASECAPAIEPTKNDEVKVDSAEAVAIPKDIWAFTEDEKPTEVATTADGKTVDSLKSEDITTVAEIPKGAAKTPEPSLVAEAKTITDTTEVPVTTKVDSVKEDDEKMDVTEAITQPDIKPKDIELTEELKTDTVEEKDNTSVKPQETKPAKATKSKPSIDAQPGPSKIIETPNALNETPESQKRKENVLRTLGLLTHKAAKEAKIEKAKEKERIYSGMMSNKSKASKSGDYTGTLKTVIKLNRSGSEKKKHRSSLKMTFQKSKHRGKPAPEIGDAAAEDEAYYTIERREAGASATTDGGHRKSHYSNRLNNHETEVAPEPTEPKETLNLVIPEKASSFSIHPGRLCMDQCFYCGGKFGLFDTPCHIAQIKSSERQKKVLDNEEKLTIDSCLCDACYRHVDRRANCPSYRKRPFGRQSDVLSGPPQLTPVEKPVSPPMEEESEEESNAPATSTGRVAICHTEGCTAIADHSIRRKWLIKMRSSVNRVLRLKTDYPGLHTIPLCGTHHAAIAPLAACTLCRRRLAKHSSLHFITQGHTELNDHLSSAGVPAQLSGGCAVCKGCRYYCTLLQRPLHNVPYARAYRRRLLQIYNIEVPPESDGEGGGLVFKEDGKLKKKQRAKSKQRKSSEPEKESESSERTNESTPEKDKIKDETESKENPLEEDIESLISSNKILVPNAAKSNESAPQSEGSEGESVIDMDAPMIPIDKQTELQYLLQKQNNPAQFLPKPNMTQKQRNIMKIQTSLSGIMKPGQQHRINEKNAKRIHKLGQMVAQKEKTLGESIEEQKMKEGIPILTNINLNDECTIETIPNKRPADINTLKNKWQMSESFTQVKKNLSELSKNKDPKKVTEVKYSNPVKRLETNPSISVRELFPGEEEMNLQCNIEFNNVKGITPEGWEKCNTLIQYDPETRKLWTELQRPYGNQSSFLRHLILLEKYFRSGDLILSQNATPHAINYSDSVQSRLRAYDNVANDAPRRSEPAISLIEFRKKSSMNGKSLLKSNQNETDKDSKKFMPPPGAVPKTKSKSDKAKSKPLPPELIAINTPNVHGRKAIQNVLHNIQQLVKGVSASDPTEVAAAPLPPPAPRLDPPSTSAPRTDLPAILPATLPKPDPPKEKKETPKKDETPKASKSSSKPWRPTLMPITPENLAKIAREPTQVAVDGRALPSLVQVLSSGKRFHITFQDYNKMCIMRREKIQQIEEKRKKQGENKRLSTEETIVTEIQPSAILGNGGTLVQNLPTEDKSQPKDMPELGQIGSNAANILKNVGLKNITIAPIPPKTATVTSQSVSFPLVSSPSLLTGARLPLTPMTSMTTVTSVTPVTEGQGQLVLPKIPRSLTVIPQTVVSPAVLFPPSPAAPETRP